MLSRRSTLNRMLLLVAVLGMVFASASPALAKTYDLVPGDIELGRQGLYVANPGPGLAASLELVKERATQRPEGVSIRALGTDVSFRTAEGRVTQPMGLVHVFFNLTRQERAAYDRSNGEGFSIWVLAPNENGVNIWTECEGTIYVERSEFGRLACPAVKNARYFLGSTVFTFETPLKRTTQ